MIVNVVNIKDVAGLEPESNPPIPGNRHRIVPFKVPLQRMQTKAGQIHILERAALIQRTKDISKLHQVLGCHSFCGPSIVKCLQSTMLEGSDH